MATASKIKSAIRSRGASQRQLTGQLASVSVQLMKARESSLMSQLEQKEEDRMFGALPNMDSWIMQTWTKLNRFAKINNGTKA